MVILRATLVTGKREVGFLRFLLAFFVVAQHLAGIKFLGASAVQIFFILSGYLMTSVMARTYGYTLQGICRFWVNRVLRLYPSYLLIILCTMFALIWLGPDAAEGLTPVLYWPSSWGEWFQNVTMLYFDFIPIRAEPRLSPPTWALTLELVCYFLISLGITRSVRVSCIWLVFGGVYLVWALLFSDHPRQFGYAAIPAAFAPFALGAILFHTRQASHREMTIDLSAWLSRSISPAGLLILALSTVVVLAALRVVVFMLTKSDLWSMLIYLLNLVPGILVVIAALELRLAADWLQGLDRMFGELSYPIYLCHWVVGIAVAATAAELGLGDLTRGPILFLLSTPPILLFSLVLVHVSDRPINRLRDKVRPARPSPI